MANNDIKIGLTLETNNVKETVKDTSQINKNLKDAADNASKIRVPSPTAAARQGVANASGVSASAAQASNSSNVSRGVTGSTGAAGRDFAAQAQGLGGLVHVYATFAANIYAATAAFGALKEAMNTLHLQQGIDQLSAQSGKNLSSLAAQMNLVTDGALSMKASLTSVANASAVGLNNKQILQMAEVAKKASQALGWDMADAMDRLTKGIGKNRPQLLDELGIIVSSNQIYQDYARQVGKTALTLTDYEKKQAFANAVLQQGLDKFGVIDIPTNPFNKLEAAASNALQSVLGLLDKGLGPVVKYLAESPTGLAISMASIAGILLKQAIPAIGAWREASARAADEAAANAKRIAASFEAFDIQRKLDVAGPIAQKATEEANAHIAGVQTALGKALGDRSKLLKSSMSGSFDAAEGEKLIATQIKGADTYLVKLQEARALIVKTDTDHLAAMDADIAKQKEKIGYLKQAGTLAAMAAKEQATAKNAMDSAEAKAALEPGWGTGGWQRQKNAQSAQNASAYRNTIANVGTNTQIMGVSGAFKSLFDDIKNGSKVTDEATGAITRLSSTAGIVGKTMTGLSGGFRILGSATMTAVSAFSEIGLALAVLGIAYAALDGWLSKATEQQDIFNTKLTEGQSSIKVATDALEFLAKKSKNVLDIQSITAMTNALDGLTTSIDGQIDSLNKWRKAAGWWDNTKDWFAGLFGVNNATVLAKNLGSELNSAINTLVFTPELQKSFQNKLGILLNIKPENISTKSISDALSNALNKPGLESDALIKSVTDLLAKTKDADAASTAATKSLGDSLKSVDQEIDTIANKLQFKDGLGKLGIMVEDLGIKMADAFKNPIKSFEVLSNFAKDPKMLAILQMNGGPDLTKSVADLDLLGKQLAAAEKGVIEAEAKVAELKAKGFRPTGIAITTAEAQLAGAKSKQDMVASAVANTQSNIFGPVLQALNKAGMDMVNTVLKDAVAKAELSKSMTDLSIAQQAGLVTANAERDIKLKELSFKEKELSYSYDLQMAIIDNTQMLEKMNAEAKAANTQLNSAERKNAEIVAAALQQVAHIRDATKNAPADFSKFSNDEKEKIGNIIAAQTLQSSRLGAQKSAATAGIGAEKYAVNRKAEIDQQTQLNTLQLASVNIAQAANAQDAARLAIQEKYNTNYSEILTSEKDSLDYTGIALAHGKDLLDLNQKDFKLAEGIRAGNTKGYAEAKANLDTERATAEAKFATATAAKDIAVEDAKRAGQLSLRQAEVKFINEEINLQQQLNSIRSEADQNNLNELIKYGAISSKDAADRLAAINAEKAQQTAAAQSKAASLQAELDQTALTNKMISQVASANTETDDEKRKARILEIAKQYSTEIGRTQILEDLRNESIQKRLELTLLQTEQLRKEQTILGQVATVSQDLANVFGQFGQALGGTVSSLVKVAQGYERLSQANEDRLKNAKTAREVDNAYAKNQEATLDFQIGATAELAGTSKKMFGEKTFAYKALDAVEKAAHLASLARTAEQLAATFPLITANITAGVTSLFATGGWAGFAGAAAFLALVASLGGPSHTGVAAGGFDAASQQKVQGTGQSYDANGNIVNNGGGALGDSSAKGKSVDDSIAAIEKYTFKTLEYNNKMLDALHSIKTNTDGLTDALVRAGYTSQGLDITGNIKTGSTLPVAKDIGDFFAGSIDKNNPLLNIVKTVDKLVPGLAGFSSKVSNAIFGGKVSTSIEDFGLAVNGLVTGLVKNTDGLINQYANVKTVTDGGLFKKTKTDLSTITDKADPAITNAVSGIFSSIVDTVTSASDVLGKDPKITQSLIDSFTVAFKISAQGLKPDELAAAINAQISIAFNQLSTAVFPELTQFQKAGEEMGTTIVRLASDMQDTSLALEAAGLSLNATGSLVDKVGITEALIKATGGLENFVTQTDYFKTNFLTAAQQLAPVQKRVTAEMTRLGFAGIKTREEFAALVGSLDLSTESGQTTYASLMNVAEGFATVYPAIEDVTTSLADLVKQGANLQDQLNKLTMSEADYRLTQIKGMDAASVAQFDYNAQLQKQIDILTQQKSITANAVSAYNDLLKAQDAVNGTSTALTDSRNRELAAMDESLRPLQKLVYNLQDVAKATQDNISIFSSMASTYATLKQAVETAQTALDSAAQTIVTGYRDAKKAVETAINDLRVKAESDLSSMASALDSFDSAAKSAASSLISAGQSIASSYKSALDNLESARTTLLNNQKTAQDALNTSYVTLAQGLNSAQDALASAQQSAADAIAQADAQAKDALRSLAKNIRDFISSISTGDLGANNDAQKFKILQDKFARESAAAMAGDTGAQSSVQATAQDYLTIAKTQSKTSLDYARIVGSVTNSLDAIASSAESQAGPAVPATQAGQDAVLKATNDVAKWQSALADIQKQILEKDGENALMLAKKAADAAIAANDPVVAATTSVESAIKDLSEINDAVKLSGISTATATVDLLLEFRKAQADVDTWNAAIKNNGIDIAKYTQDSAKDIANLVSAYKDAQIASSAADKDLADAKNYLGAIDVKQGTSLDSFKNLVDEYKKITAAIGPSQATQVDVLQNLTDANKTLDEWKKLADKYNLDVNSSIYDVKTAVENADTVYADALDKFTKANTDLKDANKALGDNLVAAIELTNSKGNIDKLHDLIDTYQKNTAIISNSTISDLGAAIAAAVVPKNVTIQPVPKDNPVTIQATPITNPVTEPPATTTAPDKTAWQKVLDQYSLDYDQYLTDLEIYKKSWVWDTESDGGGITGHYDAPEPHKPQKPTIPQYAKGGVFGGGLRIVGEQGPELEATGPSMIYSNGQTKDLLGNDALLEEIRALRDEVSALRYTAEQSTVYNKKTRDILTRVTRDGESLQTKVAA